MNYHVSVMAVVLNLFGDAVWASLAGHQVAAPAAPADSRVVRGVRRDSVVCRWCVGCPLDGLCDSDACGARPQSVSNFYERVARHHHDGVWSGRYPNLQAYIANLKRQGWL